MTKSRIEKIAEKTHQDRRTVAIETAAALAVFAYRKRLHRDPTLQALSDGFVSQIRTRRDKMTAWMYLNGARAPKGTIEENSIQMLKDQLELKVGGPITNAWVQVRDVYFGAVPKRKGFKSREVTGTVHMVGIEEHGELTDVVSSIQIEPGMISSDNDATRLAQAAEHIASSDRISKE